MDWPLIGAVSAVTIVAGVVTYEVVALLGSGPEPMKRPPPPASYGSTVERSAYELPGFSTGRPVEPAPNFPLMRLIDPDRTFTIEGDNPGTLTGPPAPAAKKQAPAVSGKTEPPADAKVAKLTTPEAKPAAAAPDPPPRLDVWRVTTTSKASYFNLGGHIDKAGNVDELANSHLRDALKTHRNFPRLPPDIRNHILTQSINLPKIAPFRGLLGIDDRTMEADQGIRFERVASR